MVKTEKKQIEIDKRYQEELKKQEEIGRIIEHNIKKYGCKDNE